LIIPVIPFIQDWGSKKSYPDTSYFISDNGMLWFAIP
jgi:hypothetical protein